ncbi:DnaT-like ssDNA-binding domain-containing protein [Marinimicrobium sp. ABcell2]|uniref:DnaT-like ssDNA-binding domain-containing protein n=1 Tax=Marinimicrobium sp. ABcell2 TaxID=3069751 RepID=UPI0027B06E95|nr:DnaT-like ssDNA-binding domain-containing protein [Marinimicrobium sp. ABcell2]MDQ2076491.1 DnaT-like ssDNA-binding domain-containing protein [Marinimicrobium sp. ABcell2]
MTSSLISEKPLVVSPSLAATIGLEEAVMLSVLNEVALYRSRPSAPLDLDEALVKRLLPFWSDYDIQRISKNLRDQGIILLSSAPFQESRRLTLTFNERAQPSAQTPRAKTPPARTTANLIAPNWQPDAELMRHIAQHNIPDYFVRRQLPEFIAYWRERGETHHSWGAKFLKHLLRQWRAEESDQFRRDQEVPMRAEWRPSRDALEVLVKHANISLAFIEDAIPEFVLYWRERGDITRTWNSKFIQHVKRQWLRYNSAVEHNTEPRRIPEDWQPSQDVYDVLRLANIDLEFARRQVPEFTLYWRDSNQVHSSWNTKFLQHVKFHWARQHALNTPQQAGQDAGQQTSNPESRTRDRSLIQDLTDRSWAR